MEIFFTEQEKANIVNAIKSAELNTSGEIRLHVESKCKEDVLDRATHWFSKLDMHKTEQRNGVLFYLAVDDKKFAVIGDVGINVKVEDNFWNSIKDQIGKDFSEGKYSEGLIKGILSSGEQLKNFFPCQSDDMNELSDEISFGK